VTDLDGFGFTLADIELSEEQCEYIATSLPSVADQRGTARDLLSHPTVLRLVRHKQLGQFLWSLTGRELVAVAARLHDSAGTSEVAAEWHQNRVVAVRERLDVRGYGPWSTRVGISHVEPPASVLDQMLVLRVHLDDIAVGGQALQILPGSHRAGKLTLDAIEHLVDSNDVVMPAIRKGVLVAMRPLLLHAMPCLMSRTQRYRFLNIEFAPPEAITPLQWHTAVHLHRAA
jgi:hypothetical protein